MSRDMDCIRSLLRNPVGQCRQIAVCFRTGSIAIGAFRCRHGVLAHEPGRSDQGVFLVSGGAVYPCFPQQWRYSSTSDGRRTRPRVLPIADRIKPIVISFRSRMSCAKRTRRCAAACACVRNPVPRLFVALSPSQTALLAIL